MKYIFTPGEPDYAYIKKSVCSLQAEYPFLKVEIAGRSACGRKIFALRFGRSANPVLIAACFHAQERLTTLVTLRFIERLCLSAKNRQTMCGIDIGGALSRREIIFVPCVNPDGVEIALHGAETAGKYRDCVERAMSESHDLWNANARGVDLNHNFNAGWDLSKALEIEAGITAPAPRRFGGYAPQTEPEVNALVRLCLRRMPRTAVALHSQGEEIYYEYGEHTPERGEHLAKIFAAASGYTLVQNAGLASHAGFKDWTIEALGIPSFTFELGKGRNPLPLSDFESVYKSIEETLVLACVM